MNIHLMRKAWRDYAFFCFGTMLLLVAFVIVFVNAVDSINLDETMGVMKTTWVRNLMRAMMGADIIDSFNVTGIISFAYAHPVVWAVVISFLLMCTSGLISGEIDRGTFDLVATLPVSRTSIYVSYSLVTIIWIGLIVTSIWMGEWIGLWMIDDDKVQHHVLWLVGAHFASATIFVCSLGLATSAIFNRRVAAGAVCFVYILYSFMLNVVEAFWPAIRNIGWTGYMHYYKPLPVARDEVWDWGNIGVLVGAAVVIWFVGLIQFSRRDIPAG